MKLLHPIPKYKGSTFHYRKAERVQRLREITAAMAAKEDEPSRYYDVWHVDLRQDCPWKCRADDPKCLCLCADSSGDRK